MDRTACRRAVAGIVVGLVAGLGVQARAEDSTSDTIPAKSPAEVSAPASPAKAVSSERRAARPSAAPRARGAAAQSQQMLTPAQEKYGFPVTPQVGGPVDTDLSKPLSLQRAIRIGLLRQNSIAIAQTQADSAQGRLTQARASFFPQVTPSYQFQTNRSPGRTTTVSGQQFGGTSQTQTTSGGIVARQLIFDTGKREANVGAARRNVFATEYGVGNSRQDVVLNITTSFFNLLRDRELVRVQQESVKRAEETAKAIEAEFEAGTAAKSDTLQSKADLENAKVALLSAQSDNRVQEASLKNAMGVFTNMPLLLDDSPIPPPDTTADPIPLERYIQTAYINRLDVKQQQERVYSQGYNVKSARISAGVTVQADVSEGYQIDPVSGEVRTFIVSATYPLFDAGSSRAVVRQNKAQWEAEKRSLDQLQQNVRLNVDQAYSAKEVAKQRQVAANFAVVAADENYRAALAKNKEGLINILELINSEVLLINAQVQQVQAIYDYHVFAAQLLRDTGLNDTIFLPRIPGAKPPVAPR